MPEAQHDVPAGTPVPKVHVAVGNLATTKVDLALTFAFESEPIRVDGRSGGPLAKTLGLLARQDSFRARRKDLICWNSGGRYPAMRYMLAGLGKRGAFSPEVLRDACGLAGRRAIGLPGPGPSRIALSLPTGADGRGEGPDIALLAQAAVEGIALGSYRMSKYQTAEDGPRPTALRSLDLLVGRPALTAAQAGAAQGRLRAEAVNLTRDLVNEPAIVVTPMRMAEVARRVAADAGLSIKVLEKKDLERMGMGALLGVAAGSHQPPCLIHLTWRPSRTGRARVRRVALVGKGLTFDSGGLSLKTASGMETMKLDKAGAAAVLSVMSAVGRIKPGIEVHGIMAMTENMPGGGAIKPGDILKGMGGRTIEVLNTDAEGRVVLSDALVYAQRQKVDEIIDLATLTGACMVALGPMVTGVFGNDQPMVDRFLDAAYSAGEKAWQLPLVEDYSDHLRSDVADIKNTPNTRYGGAITAGLFLKSFIENGTPWLHLDIAGPAFLESEQGYMRKGATGATVRALISYLQASASPG
ncbi:MAG: leucyl aminopeptidase [Candidatus Polarisedimenticolia bacterium]